VSDRPAPLIDLATTTTQTISALSDLALLVPLGSTEQHGPHLPLATDSLLADAVARAAAERFGRSVVVAPALPYGASGEHQDFAGTLSIGTAALHTLLVELGRSAFPEERRAPWSHLVLVNGHGGNAEAVRRAVTDLNAEGRPVSAWWPRIDGGDAHAGATETSLLLHLAPQLVRTDAIEVGTTAPLAELVGPLRRSGVRAVAPNGVLGDPRTASSVHGASLFAALVEDLVAHLTAVRVGPTRGESGGANGDPQARTQLSAAGAQ
jgi:mycofactocin precursor peptide peptidase